jgi:hypothetical protein
VRPSIFTTSTLTLTLAAIGCASDADSEAETDTTTTRTSKLLSSSCGTATPQRTMTGGGDFTRNPPYSATGCTNAYVVDINNYATTNDYGTWIAYDHDYPTTKAACEATRITAAVWRKGSTNTFLGETTAVGRWFVDPATNTGGCLHPSVVVERASRDYRPNNSRDFRIAIRAERTGGAISRFAFSTAQKPASSFYDGMTLASEIRAQAPGTIHPKIHATWLKKGTADGAALCRSSQLDVTLAAFNAPSMAKLGASNANLTARDNAYVAMRNALCLTGASRTETAYQSASADFYEASYRMLGDILLEEQASILEYGDHLMLSARLIEQSIRHDVNLLLDNCQTSPVDLWKYSSQGTLPAGIAADRLLLGSCTGTPADLAVRLGVGGTRTLPDARATLADCLTPNGNDVCNDPRANGDMRPALGRAEELCITDSSQGEYVPCSTTQEDSIDADAPKNNAAADVGAAAADASVKDVVQDDPTANRARAHWRTDIELSKEDAEYFRKLGKANTKDVEKVPFIGPTLKVTIDEVIDRTPDETIERGLEIFIDGVLQLMCSGPMGYAAYMCDDAFPDDPAPGGGEQQYCGPDFAPGGWYAAGGPRLRTGRRSRQMNESDRLQHCLCKTMEPVYGGFGAGPSGVGISRSCPQPAEKIAHECLSTPQGPDDSPTPSLQCMTVLQPAQADTNVWRAKICQTKRCPDGQIGTLQTNDTCECETLPPVVGKPDLGCPAANVALCTPDNAAPCLCQPIDFGNVPFGNDPGCRTDMTAFPGSLDGWTLPDPGLIAHHTIGSSHYLAFEMGTKSQVAAVSPTFFKNTFPAIGPVMRSPAFISANRPTGVNLDIQLYCTNPGNNLFHGYMGQCRLNNFTVGAPGNCDITLTSSLMSQCFDGGGFTLEWDAQAPTTWRGFMGIGGFEFRGTPLQQTPASALAPVCPRPPIDSFVNVIRPLWDDLGGSPSTPDISYALGIGGLVRVNPVTSLPIRPE